MRGLLIIAVSFHAGVTFSTAKKDQIEEIIDDLSLFIRRFNNIEEALREKDNEIMELQEKIKELPNSPFGQLQTGSLPARTSRDHVRQASLLQPL